MSNDAKFLNNDKNIKNISMEQEFSQTIIEIERQFRTIFEQSFQFVVLVKPNGMLLDANQTALSLGDIAHSNVIQKPFWEARWWTISPQTQQQLKVAIATAAQGKLVRYEVDVLGKGSYTTTMDFSLRPVKNEAGQVVLLIAEGRDITKQKKLEEEVSQNEEVFSLAFHDAAIGKALVSPDGKWLKVNRSLCEIIGYSEAELLQITFQDITHPDDLNTDLDYVRQLLAGKIRTYQMEKRYFHKQGHSVWILLSVSLVRNRNGKPLYFISQIQDIDQRKQTEVKLQKLVKELERSNNDLEEFAHVVSHDLIAPLHKIEMLSKQLEQEYGLLLDVKGRGYLERMQNVGMRMRSLIKSLLTYSRVTTQAQSFVSVNLNTVLQEVLSDLEVEIKENQACIHVGELPIIECDCSQIRQLFQNLISNALKFHKLEAAPIIKIYQSLYKDLQYEITVEDNGIGFDEENQEQIFTPFFRLHSNSQYEGTGMGLATCRKLYESRSN
ncbi:hypothetical protein CAL7716_042200 [Calothrix sp. PCC 7716]|nr:hypothetical protein CAL7716_042200 [Calothrix sp. PCC 7716]